MSQVQRQITLPRELPFNLSSVVPASSTAEEVREAPYDAVITDVLFVGSDSAQQAVGAQLEKSSGERLVPRDSDPEDAQFVPIDSHPVRASINVELDEGEQYRVGYTNNDTESHFVKAIITLQERGE